MEQALDLMLGVSMIAGRAELVVLERSEWEMLAFSPAGKEGAFLLAK
jgi:hypothetical protein